MLAGGWKFLPGIMVGSQIFCPELRPQAGIFRPEQLFSAPEIGSNIGGFAWKVPGDFCPTVVFSPGNAAAGRKILAGTVAVGWKFVHPTIAGVRNARLRQCLEEKFSKCIAIVDIKQQWQ